MAEYAVPLGGQACGGSECELMGSCRFEYEGKVGSYAS